MSADPVSAWSAAMAPLDERLRPIANRGVNLADPDWARKIPHPRQPALDEAGIRAEAESLLGDIVDRYPALDDATRHRVQELFHTFRSFAWATTLGHRPTSAERLRRHLVLVTIHDLVDDPRDTIVWLDQICRQARDAGVDVRRVIEQVAPIASDADRYRFGSTRQFMLRAGERWGKAND
jgi:hypothetical protein